MNHMFLRAFHNLAFSEFLCSMGVLLFLFMMWNHCNFFRFLKLILDHPHGGQRSQRSVCAPENANFFIYWVTELIFVSKDFIFQDNHFDIQEVQNPFIIKKVFEHFWELFLAYIYKFAFLRLFLLKINQTRSNRVSL